MTRPLARIAFRYLRRHPWQLTLAVLGIALGVAVAVSIDLANESARRAFALATEAVTGRATHQIVGGPSGLADELYRALRVDLGRARPRRCSRATSPRPISPAAPSPSSASIRSRRRRFARIWARPMDGAGRTAGARAIRWGRWRRSSRDRAPCWWPGRPRAISGSRWEIG